jgi:endonuclease YncB( thermonuclease family)
MHRSRPNLVRRFLACAALGLLVPAAALSAPSKAVEGRVQRVVDGDSLWLAPADGAAPIEVRLKGIDAPEICQAHGTTAKAALEELVAGQAVRARLEGRDTHGRQLGTVFVGERNINRVLVQEGHAWSARYKWDRGPYVADERMAKALNRGFNAAGGAVMPRDFRRTNGPCLDGNAASAAAARPAVVADGAAAVRASARADTAATAAVAPYRCDGRTRCTQMRSCAEATWFLKNCPGVEMDGDRDGVPCETQWCSPGR